VWLLTDGPAFTAVTEPALTPILDLNKRGRRRSGVDSHDPSIAVDGVLLDDLSPAVFSSLDAGPDILGDVTIGF
jgi:hypothetical protein